MSLEQALAENTATMKQLIAVLQTAGLATHVGEVASGESAAAAAGATGKARGKKADTPTPSPAPAASPAVGAAPAAVKEPIPGNPQPGDPEGTRYFHIAKHRTVAAVRPGETIPSIEGTMEVMGNMYASLKAEYAAPVPSSGAAATGDAAATPAASPAASTASSSAPATSQPAAPVDGPALLEKCKALHGHLGNDALLAVLTKFGVTKVPELIAKGDLHAAAGAGIDKLLALPKGSAIDAVNAALAAAAPGAVDNSLFN